AVLPLSPQDDATRRGFLDRLEQHRWTGTELDEFEVGLALDMDIFLHGLDAGGLFDASALW
ncbi:hypothetical protein FGG78_40695, partial [Thioclava sp. BHET1]